MISGPPSVSSSITWVLMDQETSGRRSQLASKMQQPPQGGYCHNLALRMPCSYTSFSPPSTPRFNQMIMTLSIGSLMVLTLEVSLQQELGSLLGRELLRSPGRNQSGSPVPSPVKLSSCGLQIWTDYQQKSGWPLGASMSTLPAVYVTPMKSPEITCSWHVLMFSRYGIWSSHASTVIRLPSSHGASSFPGLESLFLQHRRPSKSWPLNHWYTTSGGSVTQQTTTTDSPRCRLLSNSSTGTFATSSLREDIGESLVLLCNFGFNDLSLTSIVCANLVFSLFLPRFHKNRIM